VRGDTELAWSVDRLFLQGDYLLELTESTGWWGYQSRPTVRVATSKQPNQVLGKLVLDGLPIVGAALRDDRLYLAQGQTYFYPGPLDGGSGGLGTNGPNFFLTVVDVGNLPNLTILGQASATLDLAGWIGNWEPVWPNQFVGVAGGGSSSGGWTPEAVPRSGPLMGRWARGQFVGLFGDLVAENYSRLMSVIPPRQSSIPSESCD